ncbi:MAG: CDP-alcohol phosphatidyltransferase family protein [Candidatus Verstraetearchaeota archaeon]|nr:CDP-alcohol phosphatidyltransferase family protein [Candidatus Verstraetearchaeota archaeon]
MLNRIRSAVASALKPVASSLAALGLSPNQITVIGLVVSVLSAYVFYLSYPLWGGILLLLAGFFDIIDGAVARITGKVTKLGGILDSILDRYSDLIVIGAILLAGLCDPLWGIIAMIGSVMVSYIRARGEVEGVNMSSVGLMERAERMVILAISAIVGYTWAGIILLAILTHITVAQRLWHLMRSLSPR